MTKKYVLLNSANDNESTEPDRYHLLDDGALDFSSLENFQPVEVIFVPWGDRLMIVDE